MNFSKLNKFTKSIFILLGLILIINFVLLIINRDIKSEDTTKDNSSVINTITSATSLEYLTLLSYPRDYSSWNGEITMLPKNYIELQYYDSLNENCGLVEGMRVFYSSDLKDITIVTNKKLQKTSEQISDFNIADSIISNGQFINENAELDTFKNYCSDNIQMDIVSSDFDETQSDLEGTQSNFDTTQSGFDETQSDMDATQVVFGVINGKNKFAKNIDEIGIYIYVFGKKSDYLTFTSRSYYATEFITESSFKQCQDAKLDNYACVKRFYDKDASLRSKVESEIKDILQTYKFE